MKIEVEHIPSIVVITATGASKAGQSELFCETTAKLLASGVRDFVVELSGMSDLNEALLKDVMLALLETAKRSSRVVVVLPEQDIKSHAAICYRVEMPWSLAKSREEAIEALRLQSPAHQTAETASRQARTALRLSLFALAVAAILLLVTMLRCSEFAAVSAALH